MGVREVFNWVAVFLLFFGVMLVFQGKGSVLIVGVVFCFSSAIIELTLWIKKDEN